MVKNLNIYSLGDIDTKKDVIKHNNAFILPDGSFVLAKGYTGCNPSHQLESSALQICRKLTDKDLKKEYESYISQSDSTNPFYYLRSVLVHYYGCTLFARCEYIKAFNDRNNFFDYSIIPNPKYHDKDVTEEQVLTLKKLFEINDDGTLLTGCKETSEIIFQKVLQHRQPYDNWHREF